MKSFNIKLCHAKELIQTTQRQKKNSVVLECMAKITDMVIENNTEKCVRMGNTWLCGLEDNVVSRTCDEKVCHYLMSERNPSEGVSILITKEK
jgi:hypothetical protein